MTIKNVTLNTTSEKKKQGRPKGSTVAAKIEKKTVKEIVNLAWDYFDGSNQDDGSDPMDELLSGKKMVWKKNWLIWVSNHNKHGKIMSDKEAFESGETASDKFFSNAYREPHFVVRNKKTQKIEFDGIDFIKFCDCLNNL